MGSYCFYGVRKHRKCGLYQYDCQEWSRKPRLDKTWSNFKDHFARAFKETWISSRTSNTKSYAANVHAAQANAALFTKMQQDHNLALDYLETATQANITSVALLTKKISEILSQVATLTTKLATAKSNNARLKNRDIVQPRPSTAIGHPEIRPRQIQTQTKTAMCTPRADKNSTLTGTDPITATMWRNFTRPRLVSSQIMDTTSW